MAILKGRTFLAHFLALTLVLGAHVAFAQPVPPVRPRSDSSTAPPNTSGTNYLIQNFQIDLRQKLERLSAERAASVIEPAVGTHIVRPTSDASTQSPSTRLDSLLVQINPAAAPP